MFLVNKNYQSLDKVQKHTADQVTPYICIRSRHFLRKGMSRHLFFLNLLKKKKKKTCLKGKLKADFVKEKPIPLFHSSVFSGSPC